MGSISRYQGDNNGGAIKLEYTPIQGIAQFPAIVDGVLSGDIVLKAGFSWNSIAFVKGTLRFFEDPNETAGVESFAAAAKFVLAKDSADKQLIMNTTLKRNRHVVVVTHLDGTKIVLGNNLQGAHFKRGIRDWGENFNQRNQIGAGFFLTQQIGVRFFNGSTQITFVAQFNEAQFDNTQFNVL